MVACTKLSSLRVQHLTPQSIDWAYSTVLYRMARSILLQILRFGRGDDRATVVQKYAAQTVQLLTEGRNKETQGREVQSCVSPVVWGWNPWLSNGVTCGPEIDWD